MHDTLIWIILGSQVILLLIGLRLVFHILPVIASLHTKLPYVPSHKNVVHKIIQLRLLENKKHVVDLGSGLGWLLVTLAKHNVETQFYGVELRKIFFWMSKFYTFGYRERIHITHGDMFEYSIREADAIVGFWVTSFMPRLLEKFTNECKPDCVIISNMFPLPKNTVFSEQIITVDKETFYVYRRLPQ